MNKENKGIVLNLRKKRSQGPVERDIVAHSKPFLSGLIWAQGARPESRFPRLPRHCERDTEILPIHCPDQPLRSVVLCQNYLGAFKNLNIRPHPRPIT